MYSLLYTNLHLGNFFMYCPTLMYVSCICFQSLDAPLQVLTLVICALCSTFWISLGPCLCPHCLATHFVICSFSPLLPLFSLLIPSSYGFPPFLSFAFSFFISFCPVLFKWMPLCACPACAGPWSRWAVLPVRPRSSDRSATLFGSQDVQDGNLALPCFAIFIHPPLIAL